MQWGKMAGTNEVAFLPCRSKCTGRGGGGGSRIQAKEKNKKQKMPSGRHRYQNRLFQLNVKTTRKPYDHMTDMVAHWECTPSCRRNRDVHKIFVHKLWAPRPLREGGEKECSLEFSSLNPQFLHIWPLPQVGGWRPKFCGRKFCGHLDFLEVVALSLSAPRSHNLNR